MMRRSVAVCRLLRLKSLLFIAQSTRWFRPGRSCCFALWSVITKKLGIPRNQFTIYRTFIWSAPGFVRSSRSMQLVAEQVEKNAYSFPTGAATTSSSIYWCHRFCKRPKWHRTHTRWMQWISGSTDETKNKKKMKNQHIDIQSGKPTPTACSFLSLAHSTHAATCACFLGCALQREAIFKWITHRSRSHTQLWARMSVDAWVYCFTACYSSSNILFFFLFAGALVISQPTNAETLYCHQKAGTQHLLNWFHQRRETGKNEINSAERAR